MLSKPKTEQQRRRTGVVVAIVLAAVALYFVFVNKSQSPVPTTSLGAGQPRFAPTGSGASQSTPAGFPPFDPSAVNAAKRQLTQKTYGQVGTAGIIEVSYPEGWVPQPGPNGVSVMHPDGLALFEWGFPSAAANTSADAIFENKILPVFRRTAQDVRVLGDVPLSLAEGLLVGKEYYATAMYQGQRVFGHIMILKVNVGVTAIPGVGYLPETFKFARISGPAERFPVLYAMASSVREIPADSTGGGGVPDRSGESGTGAEGFRGPSGVNKRVDIQRRCEDEAWKVNSDVGIAQRGGHVDPRVRSEALQKCLARNGIR